jgi:hypothetical protein
MKFPAIDAEPMTELEWGKPSLVEMAMSGLMTSTWTDASLSRSLYSPNALSGSTLTVNL